MSNAERLDGLYDAFWNRRDWRAGTDVVAPDIEWVGMAEDAALGGTRYGARSITQYFSEWLEAWDIADVRWEIEEITPDVLLVHTWLHTRGRGSGLETETEVGQVWEFEDGMAVRQRLYRTFEEARRAADALVA